MQRKVELLSAEVDGTPVLKSPEVGRFTCALDRGNLISPGERAGMIRTLGETVELIAPRGVTGRVLNEKPERVHHPVGYGDVLYELAALDAEGLAESTKDDAARDEEEALVFRAPHSGRFWHRPAPGNPPFVQVGDVIEEGAVVGLVEVMKTFTHLAYAAGESLPPRARVTRISVEDGDEVTDGTALIAVEPA